MRATESIWFDGKLVPWDEAKIHVLTHTLHYGGGAFEGIRFYKTPEGPAIFRLTEHVERLLYSIEVLEMPFFYEKREVITAIKEVVRANHLEEGYIRPIAFYGYGKMGVNPIGCPASFAIACWPWGAYLAHDSVDIKTSSYIRIHPRSTKVDAKLCGHYVNSMLASLELRGTHYHEVLFLDEDGHVSEGAGENFFIVKDNVLYTPKLGTILPGITRNTIMTLTQSLGLTVQEADLKVEDVYAAEEAFFTGTAVEVTPIRSLDDHVLGGGEIGPVTQQIKSLYMDVVHGRKPEFTQYLTYV
ncbi:MAG: branched chain amino acid aminotransferase [Gammaproteobacteria bacterium RIFCSPHIGHO2_12_FULL_45_9]|nr:MAG: branched chain amino acid aminotransferase [Gammaproteobacteria bacterium RIFCSPHIGHO2_12_FULL_45_9]